MEVRFKKEGCCLVVVFKVHVMFRPPYTEKHLIDLRLVISAEATAGSCRIGSVRDQGNCRVGGIPTELYDPFVLWNGNPDSFRRGLVGCTY